ncbi:hypothetical protein ARAM_005547 [Aspergillus rambellii]|uniref:Uncharacterized protein n=2 Tax=Aspergillus subgen. Nidulantes TaxID=2720870 RepID=A0A0F8UV52_9EURO|nr:hypothetical protein AOCH_004748 [Aspergillus ochraceoroseus]KKK23373.1 hypothetical protein ARAM_005547 [Aspergillus rambellii]
MAICITFGTHEFTSMLEGYENVRAYCYNCHSSPFALLYAFSLPGYYMTQSEIGIYITKHLYNYKQPVIPLSTHKYREVTCYTCRFTQDLRDRPDINPNTRPPPGAVYGPQPPPQAYFGGPQQPPQYPQPQPQPQPQQQALPMASGAASPPPQNFTYK